jgi:hypothetical protein
MRHRLEMITTTGDFRRMAALRLRPMIGAAAILSLCYGCQARQPESQPGSDAKAAAEEIPTEDLKGSPLYVVLQPDEIPSIDDPRFVTADEATFLKDDEPVLGVFDGAVAKAYSLWQLDHHEIVNDTLGDTPIAATW